MKKILVPYDGSESAKRALQYVAELAKDLPGLEVHLLNVQGQPMLYGDYITGPTLQTLVDAAREHARKVIAGGAAILHAHNVPTITHELLGDTVQEIAKAVTELGCDTVVMGTRGMNNLSNLVMGSVSTRVVHEVSVPVLLVK